MNESLLPQCAMDVLEVADLLEAAVLADFPDLDGVPASSERAQELIDEAIEWAKGINACLSLTGQGKTLQKLFYKSSMGSGIYARDVLGAPPVFLRDRCNTDSLIDFKPNGIKDPQRDGRDILADWGALRDELHEAHRLITYQAISLVTWARDRSTNLEKAVAPRRRSGRPPKYDDESDRQLVARWKDSGLTRSQFEVENNLLPQALKKAQDRIRKRERKGKR